MGQHYDPYFKNVEQTYTVRYTVKLKEKNMSILMKEGEQALPARLLEDFFQPQSPNNMRIISWNARGSQRPNLKSDVQYLVSMYNPHMLIILDTRAKSESATTIIQNLPFKNYIVAPSMGMSGGIWILWNMTHCRVNLCGMQPRAVHVELDVPSINDNFYLSAIYNSPNPTLQTEVWQDIVNFHESIINKPWLLILWGIFTLFLNLVKN